MEPPSKAATRRPRPERDGSTISASGGHADAVRWVSTFQTGGWTSKVDMILIRTTPFSQRAEPSPFWLGLPRNAASDAGQHGFPASAADKRSEAAPRRTQGDVVELVELLGPAVFRYLVNIEKAREPPQHDARSIVEPTAGFGGGSVAYSCQAKRRR